MVGAPLDSNERGTVFVFSGQDGSLVTKLVASDAATLDELGGAVALAGEVLVSGAARDDDQGKHTTTRRELFLLANGAIVIDTPGMRELSVKGLDTMSETFEDFRKGHPDFQRAQFQKFRKQIMGFE